MAKQSQPPNEEKKAPEKRRRAREAREKAMDKTLADSYPASDPPSTIPDPAGELPEEQKDVFIMNEFDGMSFKEISEIKNEPVNTLLSRKRYAVLYLRKKLKNLYKEL